MTQISTIDDLRKISYDKLNAFCLTLPNSADSTDTFCCSNITRCLPGKRISCIGIWNYQTVFAKFFISPKRAKIHWHRERNGFELLQKKQIPAPKILHSGKHQQDEIYFILFEFLPCTTSLQVTWNNSDQSEQLSLLKQLIAALAEHHRKGVIQQDLHLNNFLLSKDRLYTLDGADIVSFDSSNKQIAYTNLALLFAQFYPDNDQHIRCMLDYYAALRKWDINQQLIDQISLATVNIREKRKKELLHKLTRKCSLFNFQRNWNQLTILSRKYQSDQMQHFIESPDTFVNQGTILKKGNTCTVVIITINGIKMVVKRYNIKNWRHFLSRAFRPSRAIRSWTNAHLLRFYGISTPKPILVLEKRSGPIRKTAYFISELSPGKTGDHFFYTSKSSLADKQTIAQSIIKLLNALHSLNISHGDLKITNFMVSDNKASIIDLDSMKQHSIDYFFTKAQSKDIKRFFKNWVYDLSANEIFSNQFNKLE